MKRTNRKAAAKKPARGGKRAPRRGFRKARDVPEWASCSETVVINNPAPLPLPLPPQAFAPNVMYQKQDYTLDQYTRASVVASAYQHYRIKKITMKFKPVLDTFASNTLTGTVPEFYYMINKSGSIPTNVSIDGLRSMGAKPLRFDDKTITVSWRPSVLDSAATAPGNLSSTAQYKISPWLSTSNDPLGNVWNPSSVDHLGIFFMVRQDVPQANFFYTVETTIEFQFKKPLAQQTSNGVAALKV